MNVIKVDDSSNEKCMEMHKNKIFICSVGREGEGKQFGGNMNGDLQGNRKLILDGSTKGKRKVKEILKINRDCIFCN